MLLSETIDKVVRVIGVVSTVTDELFVVAVTFVPALPATSLKLIVKPTVPLESLETTV